MAGDKFDGVLHKLFSKRIYAVCVYDLLPKLLSSMNEVSIRKKMQTAEKYNSDIASVWINSENFENVLSKLHREDLIGKIRDGKIPKIRADLRILILKTKYKNINTRK